MSQAKILFVDDDVELSELLGDYLQAEGFEVDYAYNADEALERLNAGHRYDLMTLDVMMPGKSGLELLQQLRPAVDTPVLMLTGRGEDIDRILGLEMGADDYLSKPCNPRELVARIRAILRRADSTAKQTLFPNSAIQAFDIELNPGTREVNVGGELLELTGTEFNVLAYLMNNAGNTLSKEQLTELVLHRKLVAYDRSLDVHVSRVRVKLAKRLPDMELIKTVRGVGYQFVKAV
ncbi:MAG: response regulator [Pontibacterium sp.]